MRPKYVTKSSRYRKPAYDLNGNRTQQTVGKATTNYTIGSANNQLQTVSTKTATTGYTYDADGSRIGDGTNSYIYDVLERLRNGTSASGTTTYVYNGLGQRVVTYPVALGDSQGDPASATSVYPGSNFLYDESGHLVGEYNSTGGLVEETIFLGDMPLAVIHPTGVYFVRSDYRNTPRQIDNSSQAAVWSWDPADFGETSANQKLSGATFGYNQRFPGPYYDGATLKNFNYFRDYDPAVGRYLESDPIGLQSGTNTYTYVGANPVSNVDLYGLLNWTLGGGGSNAGGEFGSGLYWNWESGELGAFTSTPSGSMNQPNSAFGGMAGGFFGCIRGGTNNVSGPFENWNYAIGPVSASFYYNGNGNLIGGSIGLGPGFGVTHTYTNTTLYPFNNAPQPGPTPSPTPGPTPVPLP